jgi:hypothetical protein
VVNGFLVTSLFLFVDLEVKKGWFLVCGYLGICFFLFVDLDKVDIVVFWHGCDTILVF